MVVADLPEQTGDIGLLCDADQVDQPVGILVLELLIGEVLTSQHRPDELAISIELRPASTAPATWR